MSFINKGCRGFYSSYYFYYFNDLEYLFCQLALGNSPVFDFFFQYFPRMSRECRLKIIRYHIVPEVFFIKYYFHTSDYVFKDNSGLSSIPYLFYHLYLLKHVFHHILQSIIILYS